jgi:hypothetical protein
MIENDAAAAANEVWVRLVDDHDATVSYGAIRAYITTKRKAERAGRTNVTRRPGTSDS